MLNQGSHQRTGPTIHPTTQPPTTIATRTDIAVRRELDFVPELPIPQTPADDEPDAEASGREEPGQKPEEGSGR